MKPWNQRIVAVLLIVCLLFCSFISCLPAPAYADTGSSTASKIAYISVLLAAVGVTIDNNFAVNPVAQGFLDFCQQSYQGALTAINAIKSTVGADGTVYYPYMTSQDIYSALIAYKNALYNGTWTEFNFDYDTPIIMGSFASPATASSVDYCPFGGTDTSQACSDRMVNYIVTLDSSIAAVSSSSYFNVFAIGSTTTSNLAYTRFSIMNKPSDSSFGMRWYDHNIQPSGLTAMPLSFMVSYCGAATSQADGKDVYYNGVYKYHSGMGYPRNFLKLYQLSISDVVIPYTVSVSVSSAVADTWTDSISLDTDDITYSDGLGADVLTGKSVAIPSDWLGTGAIDMVQPGSIAGQTATTLTETGVLSDTVVDPGTVDPPIEEPTSILGWLAALWAWLTSLFDVSEFQLDFSGLQTSGITTVFPFCIPFDFVRAIQTFAHAASDYSFQIDLETGFFNVHHTVDMQPIMPYIAFFRYLACVWFAFILITKTRDLIKW